ncbi:MAG: hypothetical protein AAB692_03690 [Patescibacteria group bacterium]
MAWYTSHTLRYRGRLVEVGTRYGCIQWVKVARGKPLDFGDVSSLERSSRDGLRLMKLFERSRKIRVEIAEFCAEI